ncbi:hypothetical protein KCP69_06410 [Salmonella enterica subsp. enterica]|nr:hypothetical protein KCP69_06410 [Salmonella enterica subsp. enterica]
MVFCLQGDRMNDRPRRHTQKKAAYRSASIFHKTRFGGFMLYRAAGMNGCPTTLNHPKESGLSVVSL